MSDDLSSAVGVSEPPSSQAAEEAARPVTALPSPRPRTGLSLRTARLLAVLTSVVSGVFYAWGITNDPTHYFYAAAVRSMAQNWHNFVFAAFDPAGFISVDKSPGGLWVQALFVRVFGYHSWAMLLPEVLAGMAAVLLMFAVVRRWAGNGAGLLAAVALAATPITVAAGRLNLPDMFLVLALIAAVYTFWRALEKASLAWLAGTAVLIGVAFTVKLVIALAIVPVLGAVYLACADTRLARRIWHVIVAGILAAGVSSVWLLIVALTPAAQRPYIDGSSSNSIWQMVWNYDTIGRIGSQAQDQPQFAHGTITIPVLQNGQPVPLYMPVPRFQGGTPGLIRLFSDQLGGQISWLLPLALISLGAGLLIGRRAPRTDLLRAGWLMWGGWLVVYGLVLSFAQDIHPYYTVLLAPPIAALAGAGVVFATTRWKSKGQSWLLPFGLLATGTWALALLERAPTYLEWLHPVIAVAVFVAVGAMMFYIGGIRSRAVSLVAGAATAITVLAGPLAFVSALFTQASDPTMAFFQSFDPVAGPYPSAASLAGNQAAASAQGGGGPGAQGGNPAAQGGNPAAQGGNPAAQGGNPAAQGSSNPAALPPLIAFWEMPRGVVDTKLVQFLKQNYHGEKYDMAVTGSTSAAPYVQLGMSIMTMGGFGGTTPAPTAAGLAEAVRTGQVRFVLLGGFVYNSSTSVARQAWIVHNCVRVNPHEYTNNPQMMFTSAMFDCKPAS